MNNEYNNQHQLSHGQTEAPEAHDYSRLKASSWRARWRTVDDTCQEEKWRREGKLR